MFSKRSFMSWERKALEECGWGESCRPLPSVKCIWTLSSWKLCICGLRGEPWLTSCTLSSGSLQNLASFLSLHLSSKASQLLAFLHMAVTSLAADISFWKVKSSVSLWILLKGRLNVHVCPLEQSDLPTALQMKWWERDSQMLSWWNQAGL